MNTVTCNGAPVGPGKIVCVGRNYAAHAAELGNDVPEELVVFLKPNSAISHTLRSKAGGEELHYEAELAFMVSDGALTAVALGLDLTKRELQGRLKDKGLPWEKSKAFDGSALFSEFVCLDEPLQSLTLRLEVDGRLRQQGGVSDMLYQPGTILQELSAFMSLEDGDILMTGTPAGVGQVLPSALFTGQVLAGDIPLVTAAWRAE